MKNKVFIGITTNKRKVNVNSGSELKTAPGPAVKKPKSIPDIVINTENILMLKDLKIPKPVYSLRIKSKKK